ncbi:MAG: chloride channel protein [Leptospirales bacterium]|nr:chloride channel protein [Leptospirales bacterium]
MLTLASIFSRISIKSSNAVYLVSVLIGAVTGLGAVAFSKLLKIAESAYYGDYISSHLQTSFLSWDPHLDPVLLVLLILGGLLNGCIAYFYCAEIRGSGVDYVIERFHNHEGRMRGRIAIYKSIATVFTLGTGGSAGKEGPVAQIGAGFAAMVANRIQIGPKARRTLLLTGAAAGLGAIFHAPLAGALTATEMLYREDLEADALVPCIIASIVSYLIYTFFMGSGPLYAAEHLLFNLHDVPAYFVLGLLCFLAGFLFVRTYETIHQRFGTLPIHPIVKPVLGALLVFAIASICPRVTGSSSEVLQTMLDREIAFQGAVPMKIFLFFGAIALLKILATSFTVGSGSAGGLYGPSLLIGASLGLATAALQKMILPDMPLSYISFALVGMGAFYSGVASAPIAAMVFVCELVGSYVLLPPLIIVSTIALVLSHRWTIYPHQLPNRFQSPAHSWDMRTDLLERVKLGESKIPIRNHTVVTPRITLKHLRKLAARLHATDFAVKRGHEFFGMISLQHVDTHRHPEKNTITRYTDTSVDPLTPDDNLSRALKFMLERELDKVPIVEGVQNNKLLGYIRYRDILDYYFHHLAKK